MSDETPAYGGFGVGSRLAGYRLDNACGHLFWIDLPFKNILKKVKTGTITVSWLKSEGTAETVWIRGVVHGREKGMVTVPVFGRTRRY